MKINTINAEEKIAAVASSIIADPRSWQDWSALHIESGKTFPTEEFYDASLSVKAIIESYLKDIEGSAYFCDNMNIYIICKHALPAILHQTGMHIRDLAFGELSMPVTYQLWDLGQDGAKFAEKALGDMGKNYILPASAAEREETKSHSLEESRSGPAKVLLVEDDAVTRWMVRNSLKDECDLVSAPTAHKVFSMYSSFRPDIVFLDIGLPDNSGNEVLEWIMRNDPGACVVMLSSKDDIDNISGCLEKGAKGFIPKPFVRENLLHYIRTYSCAA